MKQFFALVALLIATLSPALADTPWKIVKTYPHDSEAFTEGLFYLDGDLYESTGQYGTSNIRQVRISDGEVIRSVDLSALYFGEGIVNWGDEILSLTWRNHVGFRWDRATFAQKGSFSYPGEGWALTQDGKRIIMSDGTPELRFLDPQTMQETGRVTVTWNGKPVRMLNELEYVKGEVLANIWMTDKIARIDPDSGKVIDWIDLSALSRRLNLSNADAVPNGIAYDKIRDRLFVTGKYWPKLYEIRLKH